MRSNVLETKDRPRRWQRRADISLRVTSAALTLFLLSANEGIAGTASGTEGLRKSKRTNYAPRSSTPLKRTLPQDCQPLAGLNKRIDELSRRVAITMGAPIADAETRRKIEDLEVRLRVAEERATRAEQLTLSFISMLKETKANDVNGEEVRAEAPNTDVNPQGPRTVELRTEPKLPFDPPDSVRRPLSHGGVAPAPADVRNLVARFGNLRISGDLRFRLETLDNRGFDNPSEIAARRQLRLRARMAVDGVLNRNFDWGMRVASGLFTDPISTNQTLTDFFERKPFELDRAFVRYDTQTDKVGVQLVAGRFEPTFRRTQMVWDDDLNVEGASEALYLKTESSLRQIKLVAFQLPFAETANAKDGILYGGQLQTDWRVSSVTSASVNVAYYDWHRPDFIAQSLGAANSQVNGGITNEAGLTGGQNGFLGTTNRVLLDENGKPLGFVAGFKLFNVLGGFTWEVHPRLPITLILDFVRNVSSRIDDEQNGYWAGIQVGQAREPKDWQFGYTFTRIQQDAVLVPFNFSDILGSNSRAHMPTVIYQLASGVSLQWTGLFSQRANKAFVLSPTNRWLNRMHFDVVYRF